MSTQHCEEDTMISLNRFINERRITSTVKWADRNPSMPDDDWSRAANHYRVTLRMGRKRMTVPFSMGPAHTAEPSTADVLDCLASDAAGIDGRDFESWCADYGFNPDSRKAERTYNAIKRHAAALQRFLGSADYDALLFRTERL